MCMKRDKGGNGKALKRAHLTPPPLAFGKAGGADRVEDALAFAEGQPKWICRRIGIRPTAWVEANPNTFPGSSFVESERALKRLRIEYHHAVGLMLIGQRHHLDCLPCECDSAPSRLHAWEREGGWRKRLASNGSFAISNRSD